jgi:hypothetical protein
MAGSGQKAELNQSHIAVQLSSQSIAAIEELGRPISAIAANR